MKVMPSKPLITDPNKLSDELLEDLGWPTAEGPWWIEERDALGNPIEGPGKAFELSSSGKTFKCLDCGQETAFGPMPWKWECDCGFRWLADEAQGKE